MLFDINFHDLANLQQKNSIRPKTRVSRHFPAQSSKMKDCVMMKDGKMMVMKGGMSMMMMGDSTFKNGTMVMKDGTVKMKDGTSLVSKNLPSIYRMKTGTGPVQ